MGVDSVRWTGSCQKQAETESLDCMADGLKSLIYFADQRGCAGSIPSACYPGMLRFLTGSGVDTSREFVLNETRCHIVDGRIREVGNVDGMPLTMYRRTRRENHIRLEEPDAGREETLTRAARSVRSRRRGVSDRLRIPEGRFPLRGWFREIPLRPCASYSLRQRAAVRSCRN